MPNPQHFEVLEEDKITWYSNLISYLINLLDVLEEDKITWCSNFSTSKALVILGLEEDKIAGFSNNASIRSKQSNALEAKELQGTQTAVCEAVRAILVWKGIELQGAQIPLRDESSQPSFESGSNYRVLKLDVRCAGLANWFEGNRITEFSNACYTLLHGVLRVWKKINYKDLKLTSVFAPEQLWFGKR